MKAYFFLAAAPTFAFLIPRTFFILFFLSFRCLRDTFFFSNIPFNARRCLGSNFLRKSMESYTKAKPVDLPPPKLVRKPKHETTSGVTLYILASFSEISFLGTEDLPGCKTSTTICFLAKSRLVMNLRVRMVAVTSAIMGYTKYILKRKKR
uniref:Uncharacterized protein n=1 Tax=Daphnia magna TaxID=35525 RepID=A0A0P5H190_9CRUS